MLATIYPKSRRENASLSLVISHGKSVGWSRVVDRDAVGNAKCPKSGRESENEREGRIL
jgi:hypothetical protein